jgi:hypothetical protein
VSKSFPVFCHLKSARVFGPPLAKVGQMLGKHEFEAGRITTPMNCTLLQPAFLWCTIYEQNLIYISHFKCPLNSKLRLFKHLYSSVEVNDAVYKFPNNLSSIFISKISPNPSPPSHSPSYLLYSCPPNRDNQMARPPTIHPRATPQLRRDAQRVPEAMRARQAVAAVAAAAVRGCLEGEWGLDLERGVVEE